MRTPLAAVLALAVGVGAYLVLRAGSRAPDGETESASSEPGASAERAVAPPVAADPLAVTGARRIRVPPPQLDPRLAKTAADAVDDNTPLSGPQIAQLDPQLMRTVQDGLQHSVRDGVGTCLREHAAEGARQGVEINMVLEIAADDTVARVSTASVDEWPERVPAPMRACLLEAFEGAEFEAGGVAFAHRLEFPLLLPI